ncbi:MAG: diaminopimelate decarboxylase [bacterium]|nr:diaminopimelate decarboxylase [bacterium]
MDYFHYQNDRLFAEEVDVLDAARKIKTPFYLYSKRTILHHFHQIQEAFQEVRPLICFSVKSNSNHTLLNILNRNGSGFDLVSGWELKRVLRAGGDPRKTVFAGVGKTREEMLWALKAGIFMFNCESVNEILLLDRLARDLDRYADIAIRINPDIVPKTHRHIITGKKDTKFGISVYEVKKVLKIVRDCTRIRLKGLHFHIGSQITETAPYIQTIHRMLKLIDELRKARFPVEYLNIGGGLGIIYNKEKPATPAEFSAKVIPLIRGRDLKLIMEPGRYIVGNSGILVTRVTYIKKSLNKIFVVVDAGMNSLIRPALYEAYHDIWPLVRRKKTFTVDVVGPICETGDLFAKDRVIGRVEENEYLAFKSAGAYGMVMASTYNSRPLPGEVLADGRRFKLI